MNVAIDSPQALGMLIRAVRKTQSLRSDDLAAAAGVGNVFVIDVERGKTTVQIGKVFQLMAELGILLHAELPGKLPTPEKLLARSDLGGQELHAPIIADLAKKLKAAAAVQEQAQHADVLGATTRKLQAENTMLRRKLAELQAMQDAVGQAASSPDADRTHKD